MVPVTVNTIEEGTIRLKLKKLTIAEKEAEYLPIYKSDVPLDLHRHVTDQAINDYNASLSSKVQVEEYLAKYKDFSRLMENGVPITFFVKNKGTAKATDVSVTIELPEQIRVFDFEEIIETPEQASPKKLENPIKKAHKKAEEEWNKAFALDNMPRHIGLDTIPNLSSNIVSPIRVNTVFRSIEIKDYIVGIEQKHGIVYTKFDYFPGGYIVPLTPGKFEAKVTLMCAEYEDPEETTLKFVVEE